MTVIAVDVNGPNVPPISTTVPGQQWIVVHSATGTFKIRPEDLVGLVADLIEHLGDLTVSSGDPTDALTYVDAIKARVTALENVINAGADGDSIVNTFNELLAAMSNFPEGTSVLAEFSNRYTKAEVDDLLDDLETGVTLSASGNGIYKDGNTLHIGGEIANEGIYFNSDNGGYVIFMVNGVNFMSIYQGIWDEPGGSASLDIINRRLSDQDGSQLLSWLSGVKLHKKDTPNYAQLDLSSLTSSNVQTIQDKSGVLAHLEDVELTEGTAAITISGTSTVEPDGAPYGNDNFSKKNASLAWGDFDACTVSIGSAGIVRVTEITGMPEMGTRIYKFTFTGSSTIYFDQRVFHVIGDSRGRITTGTARVLVKVTKFQGEVIVDFMHDRVYEVNSGSPVTSTQEFIHLTRRGDPIQSIAAGIPNLFNRYVTSDYTLQTSNLGTIGSRLIFFLINETATAWTISAGANTTFNAGAFTSFVLPARSSVLVSHRTSGSDNLVTIVGLLSDITYSQSTNFRSISKNGTVLGYFNRPQSIAFTSGTDVEVGDAVNAERIYTFFNGTGATRYIGQQAGSSANFNGATSFAVPPGCAAILVSAGVSGNYHAILGWDGVSGGGAPTWSSILYKPNYVGDPRQYHNKFWDFENGVNGTPFLANVNAGGAANSVTPPAGMEGAIALQISTSTNSLGGINTSSLFSKIGAGLIQISEYINIEALSNGTDTYLYRWGAINSQGAALASGAEVLHGVYFEYSSAVSANWRICTVDNTSNVTKTATSVAVVAGTNVKLTIVIDAAGTSASYYIDDVFIATISTTFPSNRQVGINGYIYRTSGSSNFRTIYCDYISYDKALTTSRP